VREERRSVETHALPFIERDVVRLVVVDVDERVLLLRTRDAGNPDFGTSWELPGGGIESGETYTEAAVRELREETGILISAEQVSAPTWRRDVRYTYRAARRLQHESIAAVRLPIVAPAIDSSHLVDVERDDHFDSRWWKLDEIAEARERFYPKSLPSLLRRFLVGEVIDEPEESWP
jgi:8-oxo-dGTP pyrophosphatase MutT (NUDIX family)